ncbi:MAG: type I DNA topoisomerase [Anaerolineales bacterium]|nr:type I DNA topoisomerase [Anaerolineales bacterium]MDW8160655.1 type I DNA topoisomerase [Anaerolineales bacterium]
METLEAYCVKCKEKRPISEPRFIYTSSGTPATEGVCSVCGTRVFRMGRTLAHGVLSGEEAEKLKPRRSGKLVIVESPAKARTVGRFLGKEYTVKASIGHVRDLLRSQLSVDIENDFEPKYRVPNEKKAVVKEIRELAKSAEEVYLATDPDREGEAIAWHLIEAASIDPKIVRRVVFHEITEPAIKEAFAHPRGIDRALVDAQQARRVLDRLVGYNLSPLLWRKVRSRLSAGRVQSVALRMIVEREREIQAFVPVEYWSIAAEFLPEGGEETFVAKLARLDGEEPSLGNEEQVRPILQDMEGARYWISQIKQGERRRNPAPPFITSTLQQDASRKLGFTAKRTMALAQQLYEGIDIGSGGSVGLITYMRTDSTNVSELAQEEARQYIAQRYGETFLPAKPPRYKTKTLGAQEAHEAIRPTSVFRTPESLREFLNRDQFRLYQLIWQRFVASQMNAAIFDTISVEVSGRSTAHEYLLRASGSAVRFSGYMAVYEEAKDEDSVPEEEATRIPSGLAEGQVQKLVRLIPEQHFTQPPPRYTEATLVRALEEYGIGRPSTYAPILSTIQQRGYVVRENKRLIPTETGMLVNDLIAQYFPEIVDYGFTAHMEEDLDRIAAGKERWVDVIRQFYTPFAQLVSEAERAIPEMKGELEPVGRKCPECDRELVIRFGRYGKFISCSGFPECRYTEAWLEKMGVRCPRCGGELVERKTRRGRVFYGCSNYPECGFTSWKRPLPAPCPECGGLLVVADKNNAQCLDCEERFPLDEMVEDEMASTA